MAFNVSLEIERYAQGIYSPNKQFRQESRRRIIELTNNFSEYPDCGDTKLYPHINRLSSAIYNAYYSSTFPYVIDSTHVTHYIIDPPSGKNEAVLPVELRVINPKVPAYVVLMAHGSNPSDGQEVQKLTHQINLLRTQGFESTEATSSAQFDSRMRVVVGVNCAYSIDTRINKAARARFNELNRLTSSQVKIASFMWIPKWLNRATKVEAKTKDVKRLFRLITESYPEVADRLIPKLNTKKPIPMQLIREEIKNSPFVLPFVKSLRRGYEDRPVLAVTWDDDAVNLRTGQKGVFSHYDDLFRANNDVMMATTGYIMKHPQFNFVEISTRADLIGRRTLGRASYFTEANFVVRVLKGVSRGLGFSYMNQTRSATFSMESTRVIQSLQLANFSLSKGKMVVLPEGEIETTGNRAEIPLHLRTQLVARDFYNAKNLKSLLYQMQSCFDVRNNLGPMLALQLPQMGTKEFNGAVADLFNVYNPVHFAEAYLSWTDLYFPYFSSVFDLYELSTQRVLAWNDLYHHADEILKAVPLAGLTRETLAARLNESVIRIAQAKIKFMNLRHSSQPRFLFVYQNIVNVSFNLHAYFVSLVTGQPYVPYLTVEP